MSVVRIGVLFPTTFNLNADAANAAVIARRLTLSGIDAEVVALDIDAIKAGTSIDALIIGSPSSSALESAEATSPAVREFIRGALANDIPTLAVSNGFHLLGTMTGRDGVDLGGLGLLPVATEFGAAQHVTIGAQIDSEWGTLVGIENHNASVVIDDAHGRHFGDMIHGVGNGSGSVDGQVVGSLWGTHLHGPVFALNPTIADEFARLAARHAGIDYVPGSALEPIDRLAQAAREHLVRRKSS